MGSISELINDTMVRVPGLCGIEYEALTMKVLTFLFSFRSLSRLRSLPEKTYRPLKQESVAKMAFDGILYMTGTRVSVKRNNSAK